MQCFVCFPTVYVTIVWTSWSCECVCGKDFQGDRSPILKMQLFKIVFYSIWGWWKLFSKKKKTIEFQSSLCPFLLLSINNIIYCTQNTNKPPHLRTRKKFTFILISNRSWIKYQLMTGSYRRNAMNIISVAIKGFHTWQPNPPPPRKTLGNKLINMEGWIKVCPNCTDTNESPKNLQSSQINYTIFWFQSVHNLVGTNVLLSGPQPHPSIHESKSTSQAETWALFHMDWDLPFFFFKYKSSV